MKNIKKMIIITSGTGGHIFPAISIANYLKLLKWEIYWIAPKNRLEKYLIPKYGIKIKYLNFFRFGKNNVMNFFLFPFKMVNIFFKIKKIIKKYKPNVVLGMGGYASFPCICTAWFLGVKTVIHEQNSVAGLSNFFLSKIANIVLQAFPNTFSKGILVGNPIRKEILNIEKPEKRFKQRYGYIRILVVGGSQGSDLLNKSIPIVVCKLNKKVLIWHQTGQYRQEKIKSLYKHFCNYSCIYKINDFIDNIHNAYSWADLIICRSGALTVSEIAYVGLGAFFIPYKHKDKQQLFNALLLQKIGAAKIFKEDFLIENLIISLNKLSRSALLNMAKKSHNLRFVNSEKFITDIIRKI